MKVENFPIRQMPAMFCFGGRNISIEISKIKEFEELYWYGNDGNELIPVLMITLQDGTKISADFENADEIKEAIKSYKKQICFRVIK